MKIEASQPKYEGILVLSAALFIVLIMSHPAYCPAADRVVGNMMLINDNGGWCWYQDDKIIYDPVGGNVITSTAAQSLGFGGTSGTNHMDTTTFNIATGKRTRVLASTDAGDDHDMGALWIRPDGRYLHMYAPHYSSNDDTYFRLATNPNDGSAWGAQQSYNWKTIPGPTRPTETQDLSYTNVHYLSGEGTGNGRLYNIARVFTRTPNLSYSDDWGQTWNYMGRLNSPVGGATYSNFYHKFRGNGVDRIDFIGCENHPRDFNNSLYHGYIKNGKSYNSYGVEIDTINDATAPSIQAFTPVFLAGPQVAGSYHTAWSNEIEIDTEGHPVCLFQTRYGTTPYGNGSGQATIGAGDHRFFYGRFNGSAWTITELGKMGTGMHAPEQDYIGMGCIHPDDVNIIYIATPFDPRDDSALSHREIFKGVTPDRGLTWDWTQITIDSTVDNIRPAIPKWDKNNTAVFWTRGVYPNQESYDFVVVGIVEEENQILGLVSYIDANTTNTTNADGSQLNPTGPSGSAGSADSRWHQYTGYGNGGSCYTAGDGGTENVPTIKTTITGLADGTYDVFAYFWCDPAQDWGIRGGFSSSDMLCFNKQSSQWAEASQFSGSVTVVSGSYQLYRVYIGRQEVTGGSSIVVYLDNYDSSYSGNVPTRTTYDGVGVATVAFEDDTTPPTPNPMTWAAVPTAIGPATITMTATTATDSSLPVQYYFECTTDGTKTSGWQSNTTYIASGLNPSTSYSFRVQARDNSPAHNLTGWSSTLSATTDPPDTTPPTPNPMTWASVPTATGAYTITMTATTATDANSPPVQYYFECTTDGDFNSTWQSSPTYLAAGLTPSTSYSFRARARDSAPALNMTAWSTTLSAITQQPPTDIEILGSWLSGTTHTKETGTNRALIFFAFAEKTSTYTLNSVTYGGRTMTKILDAAGGTTTHAYVAAYILNDANIEAATNTTFVPSWSTTPSEVSYESVFLSNVNQTTPIGASDGNAQSTTTPLTISADPLATTDGDMVFVGATSGNTIDYTVNNGFTEALENDMASSTGTAGYKSATGAVEIPSVTASGNVNRQAIIGFVVKAGTPPDTAPAAPTGLIATAGNKSVILTWNSNSEPDMNGYNVYRSTIQGGGYAKINGSLLTNTTYTDTGLTNGTPYYYVVTAADLTGHESTNSSEATATPDYQSCGQVIADNHRLTADISGSGDCYVDFDDLYTFADNWLRQDCISPDNCGGADFDPTDGVVDFFDFTDFADQWLTCNDPENPDCQTY